MSKLNFVSKLNTELGSVVASLPVVVASVGQNVPVSCINGVVLRAGALATTISDGDSIYVEVISSNAFATPVQATVTTGNNKSVFTVVTKNDPTLAIDPAYSRITPVDLVKYASGQRYVPSSVLNSVIEYDSSGQVVYSTNVATASAQGVVGAGYRAVCDIHNDRVLFVDSTNAVRSSVSGLVRPACAITVPSSTYVNGLTWVAVSGSDKIVAISENVIVEEISVIGRPVSIAATSDGSILYVACADTDHIIKLVRNALTWAQYLIVVAPNPHRVLVTGTDVWVTCLGDTLYKVDATTIVTSFAITGGLRGIAATATGIVVACATESKIKHLDTTTSAITEVATALSPLDIGVAANGDIYVSSFGESKIQRFSSTLAPLSEFSVPNTVHEMHVVGSKIFVSSFYSNCPKYIRPRNQNVVGFGINDVLNVRPGAAITSNTVVVSGIETAVGVSIPNAYSAMLYKNGVGVGTSCTVVSGDSLYFTFIAPNVYDVLIDMPMYVGNFGDAFVSVIAVEDVIVDPFQFNAVVSAVRATPYTSNSVTVTGIDVTAVVTLVVVGATIVLNGVDTALSTTTLVLNDVFALKTTTADLDRNTQFVSATIGGVSAQWSLTTAAPPVVASIISKDVGPYGSKLMAVDSTVGNLIRISLPDYTQTRWLAVPQANPAPTQADPYLPMALESSILQFVAGSSTIVPRFVACAGNNSVYDTVLNEYVFLSGTPRELGSFNGTVYVAQSNGIVSVIEADIAGSYKVVAEVLLTGNLYALTIDASGNVWTVDITSDTLYKVFGRNLVQTIVNVGGDIWSMAADATSLWTANSYDNSVSRINLFTGNIDFTVPVLSVPSLITVDGSGHIWVAHYGTTSLLELSPTDGSVLSTQVLPDSSAAFMFADASNLWVIENNYPISSVQSNLSMLPAPIITFTPQLNAQVGTTIRSNAAVVSGLTRATGIKIGLLPRYRLFVNSVRVDNGVYVTVNNGDVVEIEVDVVTSYSTPMDVSLFSYQSSSLFRVMSQSDPVPDTVFFASVYDAYVGRDQLSSNVVIAGLTPGEPTIVSIPNAKWSLVVNGVKQLPSAHATVYNGDVIAMSGPPRGVYGQTLLYELQFRPNMNIIPVTFGVMQMTNRTLNGALPAPRDVGLNTAASKPFVQSTANGLVPSTQYSWDTFKNHVLDVASSAWSRTTSKSSVGLGRYAFSIASKINTQYQQSPAFIVSTHHLTNFLPTRSALRRENKYVTLFSSYTNAVAHSVGFINSSAIRNRSNAVHSVDQSYSKSRYLSQNYVGSLFQKRLSTHEQYLDAVYGVVATVPQHYVDGAYVHRGTVGTNTVDCSFAKNRSLTDHIVDSSYTVRTSTSQLAVDSGFTTLGKTFHVVGPQPYVRQTNVVTVEMQIIVGRAFGRVEIASSVKQFIQITQSSKYTDPVIFRKADIQGRSLAVPAMMPRTFHTVWDYTAVESASTEGLYATAALAVAAGHAAGHTSVSAFPVNGHFIYTVLHPIQNTGCGLQPIPNSFPVPDKWYVHGG